MTSFRRHAERRTEAEAALGHDAMVAIERTAIVLARLAGAEIVSALGGRRDLRYKSIAEGAYLDPVSEVDHAVETIIRAILGERFPDHDIIGEEIDDRPRHGRDVVWVIDPVDGTTNFVNGFPLFSASIGVVWRGCPIVGALWCSTSHTLRAGVYHARAGGGLGFDETPVDPGADPAVRRRLVGDPHAQVPEGAPYDARKTGSAALECAFVAAGLLAAAKFARPNVWDVAGGIALVEAAGGVVATRDPGGDWRPFDTFPDELGSWRSELALAGSDGAFADLDVAT